MKKKPFDEVKNETLKLYDKGATVDEIVKTVKSPQYLIESILINHRDAHFR